MIAQVIASVLAIAGLAWTFIKPGCNEPEDL